MSFILFFLLISSILLETARNVFSNNFSKNVLVNKTDIYKFNTFMYIGSFAIQLFFNYEKASLFTIITAFVFALAIWLNQFFLLEALKCGPMSFTNFIISISLIIPIIYGAIVWNEKIRIHQIILLGLLVIAMALALDLKKEKFNRKWLISSILSMLFLGIIGILQTTHQTSKYSSEIFSFLRIAFAFTIIINLLGWQISEKKEVSTYKIKSNALVMAAVSGIAMGLVHIISLYLSGVMKKVIFFPLSTGGLLFITVLSAVIFFKEKLNLKQTIGIIIGTIALSLIGI